MGKIQPVPKRSQGQNIIRFPINESDYTRFSSEIDFARSFLKALMIQYPEIFPASMHTHYVFYGLTPRSRKMGLCCRRIRLKRRTGAVYTLIPSFVMPNMCGLSEAVAPGLLLLRYNVPYWVVASVLGRDAMYWYRLACGLGRFNLVGTTVKAQLPRHLLADEKHTRLCGKKAYVALTSGAGCILGASLCESASEDALTAAYGVFASEANSFEPAYSPETINTDGWWATQNAWQTLFASVVVIQCFLHSFIKIRRRATKKLASAFNIVSDKAWQAYRATTKRNFSQRLRRLREWAEAHLDESPMKKHVLELCDKRDRFIVSYDHKGAHRTSNMVDRLMKILDRAFFAAQYFHGSLDSGQLRVRSLALLWNFCPSAPATVRKYNGQFSPAERLNGYRYHDNWLENLLISASLNGQRDCQLNPL